MTFALKERTFHWLAERMTEEILAQAIIDPALRAEIPPLELLSSPAEAITWTRNYLLGALLLQAPAEVAELARKAATSVAQ